MSDSSRVYRRRNAGAASEAPSTASSSGKSYPVITDTSFQGSSSGAPSFEFWLFFWMIMENWILDFGRPVANFGLRILPVEWPGVGDFFHMAYNIITPFLLLKMMDRTAKPVAPTLKYLIVITFTLGASLHLVGDSIQSKLVQNCGINLSEKVKDLAVMKALNNQDIVHIFEMTYGYDEHIGHYLWYVPYFGAFILYFNSCFIKNGPRPVRMPLSAWALQPLGISFYWYLIVEGQVWPLGLFAFGWMGYLWWAATQRGERLDVNGQFLCVMFGGAMALFCAWLVYMAVPPSCVYKFDLDCVPEFWESYPWLYKYLIRRG